MIEATDAMRKMAKMQLQEMQIVVGAVVDADQPKAKEKKSRFALFRRKNSPTTENNNTDDEQEKQLTPAVNSNGRKIHPRIQYKSDGKLGKLKRDSRGKNGNDQASPMDMNLQQALASSLAVSSGRPDPHDKKQNRYDSDLEMALAMSLSESNDLSSEIADNGKAVGSPKQEASENQESSPAVARRASSSRDSSPKPTSRNRIRTSAIGDCELRANPDCWI